MCHDLMMLLSRFVASESDIRYCTIVTTKHGYKVCRDILFWRFLTLPKTEPMHKRYTHNPKVQAIESNPQKIKKPKKDAAIFVRLDKMQ